MRKPRILVVADYYLPGFRAGGPIRAISNSIRALGSDADFFVVTRDHDTDGVPYQNIQPGCWHEGVAGTVHYSPHLTVQVIERCVATSGCDLIWLNSFFSRASLRVLALRRLGRLRQPVLLSPRGEFSPGALALKPLRKSAGLALMRMTGCLRSIHWLASSNLERQEIGAAAGVSDITCVPERVSDLPMMPGGWPLKERGLLRLVFASRIDRKKNLHFLLEVLASCTGRIQLDIVGPIDDPDYWEKCRLQISRLPATVEVSYKGEAPHAELLERLREYDAMALPTLGENFGHIVVEAWAAGCPVLLSDRTPWRNLAAQGIGWDLPLDHDTWARTVREGLHMNGDDHLAMRKRAVERARRAWQDGVDGDNSLRVLMRMRSGAHLCR